MRAREWLLWLLPVLVLGWVACSSDDEVVDPGTKSSHDVVMRMSGDHSGELTGDYAVLELFSAGPDSRVDLMLQVTGGTTLRIYSPLGENTVTKTVYEVEESESDDWHARLEFYEGPETQVYAATDGFVTMETVSQTSATGFFHLETRELDSEGNLIPGGEQVQVQGTFSADIQRSSPGTRAVMKGTATWRPIAAIGSSR